MHAACKHARWRGQKLHDVFADGKALCEAQNFAVQAVGTDGFDRASLAAADEASCFGITTPHDNAVGTASGRRPNRWLSIGAAACVTMLSIKRPRGCILTDATPCQRCGPHWYKWRNTEFPGGNRNFCENFCLSSGFPSFSTRKENLLLTLEAEIDRNVPLVAEVTLNRDGRWLGHFCLHHR